jgi:hypothetical protein
VAVKGEVEHEAAHKATFEELKELLYGGGEAEREGTEPSTIFWHIEGKSTSILRMTCLQEAIARLKHQTLGNVMMDNNPASFLTNQSLYFDFSHEVA